MLCNRLIFTNFAKIFKERIFMKKTYLSPLAAEVIIEAETVLAASAPAYRNNPSPETNSDGKVTTWGSLWN